MSDRILEHVRFGFGRYSTMSRMYMWDDLEKPAHFVLEDERRKAKVSGRTCIPTGLYRLTLRAEGGMHEEYAKKFPGVHKGMLHLLPAEEFTFPFTWVYYHIGNKPGDTNGCPLVGTYPVFDTFGEFSVGKSTDAYLRFYERVVGEMESGRKVYSRITEAGVEGL